MTLASSTATPPCAQLSSVPASFDTIANALPSKLACETGHGISEIDMGLNIKAERGRTARYTEASSPAAVPASVNDLVAMSCESWDL